MKSGQGISLDAFMGFMSKRGISLNDLDAIREINLKEVRKYMNGNQPDQKNFLALRVFAKKWESEITNNALETLA